MNTARDERIARYVFGELRLVDLWEESKLEGLMTLNGIERITAGLNDARSHVEFLSPKADRFTFVAATVIKFDGLTATFSGPVQNGKGPGYTLILNRRYDALVS